jgi:hypothetical protein
LDGPQHRRQRLAILDGTIRQWRAIRALGRRSHWRLPALAPNGVAIQVAGDGEHISHHGINA